MELPLQRGIARIVLEYIVNDKHDRLMKDLLERLEIVPYCIKSSPNMKQLHKNSATHWVIFIPTDDPNYSMMRI